MAVCYLERTLVGLPPPHTHRYTRGAAMHPTSILAFTQIDRHLPYLQSGT